MPRIVLGISYNGHSFSGWQSQASANTVQDVLERALADFGGDAKPVSTVCAGRTDAGVHAAMQVAHFDTELQRDEVSWVRGTNRFLPASVAVEFAREVTPDFHSRASARTRRYAYVLLESTVRPSLDAGRVGWSFRPLDGAAMQAACDVLLGEHDFSSFRAAQCQALSPVKTLLRADATRHGSYWRFDFEANAFLHHMIRNIMGCVVAVGNGSQSVAWLAEVLAARCRQIAAPTFAADGLYFLGPRYDAHWAMPERTPVFDALPGGPAEPSQ
jgi:tRNA pseudouridine38-40 synthase